MSSRIALIRRHACGAGGMAEESATPHREFCDAVPRLRMRDQLAQILDAADDGET
jgi:hypothetical protein